MNYQLHYDRLIARAKSRSLSGYVERHHIIPRCIGGGNSPDNIVKLTPEEHYVAHQLLIRIYPNQLRLAHAALMMASRCSGNKPYGWLRKANSLAMKGNKRSAGRVLSDDAKRRIGKVHIGNKWASGRVLSEESRKKISDALRGKAKSEEHRKKLSEARIQKPNLSAKGVPVPKDVREKISASLSGRKQSQETIAKRSSSLIGRPGPQLGKPRTEEDRAKISAALRGRPKSAETKARMSEAQKGNKKALGLKRGPMSPEHKAKMIESRKRNKELNNGSEKQRVEP